MLYKLLISNLFLFTLINCTSQKLEKSNNSQKTETSISENNDSLIYLKEGENIFLKEQQVNVTFKGIISDSRCPKDLNCIWAGAATVSVEIMTTTSRPMLIELSTVNLDSKNLTKTQNIAGYNITLEKVLPLPTQGNNMKGNYQIALKIEK